MATEPTSRRAARAADDHALYIISVAAELAGVHPQTLRIYERKGLVRPQRTTGNRRRYSDADISRLRIIQALTEAGVNLAGVKRIFELEAEVDRLLGRVADLERELRRRPILLPDPRAGSGIIPRRSVFSPPWEDRA